MSAGDLSPARRIPVPDDPEDRQRAIADLRPGDYLGPIRGYTHEKPAVFFRLPAGVDRAAGGIRHVVSPPHVFREQPDGSLEIRESLGCERRAGGGYVWHGYLDAGNVWREI